MCRPGSVLTICASTSPASSGTVGGGSSVARRSVPAQPEVLRDVCHRRAFDPHRGVVPADSAPRDVVRCVPRIAAVERQVDAAHERDLAVDHDRLLVMAVREARAAVGVGLDLRVAREPVEHLTDVRVRRLEQRHRCPLPREQPHVDALRELGEQIAHDHRLVVSRQVQLRREEPAGEVDERLGARELVRHGGKRLRSVHEEIEAIAGARRERPVRIAEPRGIERSFPADVPESLPVATANRPVEPLAERVPELDGRRLEESRRLRRDLRPSPPGRGVRPVPVSSSCSLGIGVRRRPPEGPRARARPPPRSTRGRRASPPRSRCTPACRSGRGRRG